MNCSRKLQTFLGSKGRRSRLTGDIFIDVIGVYEDNGRAGYEDAGPGMRRLSANEVVIFEVEF